MPATVNGVGTKYYGKRNCFGYDNYCSQCNRYVRLLSYDTREWFVILFIPIVPLQKKRIIDYCPSCTRHRVMSLKKYLKARDEAYAEATEKYNANPNDPEAVSGLLGTYGAYRDMASFEALKKETEGYFSEDSTVQAAIGYIYYNYGNMESARTYFEKSLSLHDDENVHEALGFLYLRLSEPDKAARHFEHIVEKRIQNKTGFLFSLVNGYQAKGRHQDAIDLMDIIVDINPSIVNDKNYKKTRKLSEKNLHTSKPVKNRNFVRTRGGSLGQTPVDPKKALGIVAAIILLAFLVFSGISFYMGKNANVYLVNGLSRPYAVVLDGKTYTIPASGYQKIKIPEGLNEFSVSDKDIQIAGETLELASSFWKRPFLDRVYIINPDTIALVQWANRYYAKTASRAPDGQWRLYVGEVLYVFDGVDFPFKPFPDEITVSDSAGTQERVQVSMVREDEIPRIHIPNVIEHYLGYEKKMTCLKKIMLYEPDNMTHVYRLYAEGDMEAFIETARCGLDAIPVRVGWHRMYQAAMDIKQPDYDLQAEYKKRLEKMPQDSAMLYLYGRTLTDRGQACDWYQKAITAANPTAYGYYGLGYDAMTRADYESALGYFEKALKIEPQNFIFCDCYYEMLVATNRIEKAVDYSKQQMVRNDDNYGWLADHVDMLRQLGSPDEAKKAFDQWCRRNRNLYSPEDFKFFQQIDQLSCVYPSGDFDAIRRVIGEPNQLEDKVLLTLNEQKSIPDELMVKSGEFPPTWMLLFYISETQLGNKDNAELFLKEASKRLHAGDYYQRYAADCLMKEAEIDVQEVCNLAMDTQMKAVVLTALGVKYPEHQQRFFDLAKRLNYKKVFPYHYLNSVYDQSSGQTTSNAETKSGSV